MGRTHYAVLGIDHDDATTGVRAAYRDMERRFHPQRTGPGGVPSFLELRRAHDVLEDPRRRRAYDLVLVRAPPQAPAPPAAEPDAAWSLRRDCVGSRPSVAEIVDRIARNFSGRRVPKSEHVEVLGVTVLTPDGAWPELLTLAVPTFEPCGSCHGTGLALLVTCPICEGEGLVEREGHVELAPARAAGRLSVALTRIGVENLALELRVASASA